jgi:hypothetical protein
MCLVAFENAGGGMIRNERAFRRILLFALAFCLSLYAEETIHYLRCGWNSPDDSPRTRGLSQCRPVPGNSTDIECPVRGFGMARYRYQNRRPPPDNDMVFIDRNQ